MGSFWGRLISVALVLLGRISNHPTPLNKGLTMAIPEKVAVRLAAGIKCFQPITATGHEPVLSSRGNLQPC